MNIKLSSLNKGLVAHWTMSQDSLKGSLLADKTPYSNDGTIYGATFTTDRMGKANSAMSFDGANTYISCGNNNVLNVQNITISAWIYPTTIGGSRHYRILHKNGTFGYMLNIYSTTLETYIGGQRVVIKVPITINNWYFVTVTAEVGGNIKTYLNGVITSNTSYTGTINGSTDDLEIGKDNSSNSFWGYINKASIYNRALSEPEIKTLYNSYNPNIKMKTSLPKIKFSRALKGTFIDSRDGTEYKTIKIGNQTWMAENLKYLPSVVGSATGSETDPYYYVYGYNGTDVATAKATTNFQTYGVLYNWPAASNACPTGWHLPTDEEYKTLEKYLGMTEAELDLTDWRGTTEGVGTKLKSGGYSDFEALMGGYRHADGSLRNIVNDGYFWSSNYSPTAAWRRRVRTISASVYRSTNPKDYGFSVRCIRDY